MSCTHIQHKMRVALHSVNSTGIGGRHWQSRHAGVAAHAHIECAIRCNNAAVAAEGDREPPRSALSTNCVLHTVPLELAKTASSFSSWLAGWLAHAPVGLMGQGYHSVDC